MCISSPPWQASAMHPCSTSPITDLLTRPALPDVGILCRELDMSLAATLSSTNPMPCAPTSCAFLRLQAS